MNSSKTIFTQALDCPYCGAELEFEAKAGEQFLAELPCPSCEAIHVYGYS